jgi:hypothetical protein
LFPDRDTFIEREGRGLRDKIPIALAAAALVVALLGTTPLGQAAGDAADSSLKLVGIQAKKKPLRGPRGPRGPAGPRGPQGPVGSQGPQGLQGPLGAQGVPGAQGVSGADGATGPKGEKGDTGERGPQGFQGPAGVFTGTFRSQNRLYSIEVTNRGVFLRGPGGTVFVTRNGVGETRDRYYGK